MATDPAKKPEAAQAPSLKPYQKIHEPTGEVVDKFKYLTGHPRQYRFDGKLGQFNIDGTENLGRSLTFQPIAWRIFTDNILGMGTKNWAEIFFIDENDCVSAVLFHGYSVDNLYRLIEPLYYNDLTLADVVITATAEKKQNAAANSTYYLAEFTYKKADVAITEMYAQYARIRPIYRAETLTDQARNRSSFHYTVPPQLSNTETPALNAATE